MTAFSTGGLPRHGRILVCIIILTLSLTSLFALQAPDGLMCELLARPEQTTIADFQPEFGWIVRSDLPNDEQTAWQILVASSLTILQQNNGNLWDSGQVLSGQSTAVSYSGAALAPSADYCWKVRCWDRDGQPSPWSDPQSFKTAAAAAYATARYNLAVSPVSPVSVTPLTTHSYLIDFGRDGFGYLQLRFGESQTLLQLQSATGAGQSLKLAVGQAGAVAPGAITVHFGEKLKNGRIDRAPGGTIRYYQTTATLQAGQNLYEIHPPGYTGGIAIPASIGRIAPFRYVEIENCPVQLTASQISQMMVHYPFDMEAASFQCDNDTLNQIWKLCQYSIKATSFAGVYVDGDRERIPYEADAYINQLCHYAVDREFSLARYSHEYLMAHSTWPTEWKQHSVMMAWADYLYTGDKESLAQYYTALKTDKLLAQYARAADGLLNTASLRDIVDWPAGERDGYDFKPVNTVVNAFYYHTLNLMASIAGALDKNEDAAAFTQEAQRIYTSFNALFWNPQTKLYVDGEGSTHSSLHANMVALAFGLASPQAQTTVSPFVISKGMACSVYGAQYLLEGLYLAGQEQAALALMTSDGPRSWVNMMREGSTITMEAWGIAYKPNLDWNHAWGAAPGNIIPRFLMGIRSLTPGSGKVLIQPQPGAIRQAQITLPTIRGAISMKMDWQPTRCTFDLTLPANVTARFGIPQNCNDFDQVLLDGSVVTPQMQDNRLYLDPIGSGPHQIICRNQE